MASAASHVQTPMACSLFACHGSPCSKSHLLVQTLAPGELVRTNFGRTGYGWQSVKHVHAWATIKAVLAESPPGSVVVRDRTKGNDSVNANGSAGARGGATKSLDRARDAALTDSFSSVTTTSRSEDKIDAEEALAEARAAERAVNAAVYSPLRLSQVYGGQPFKVANRALDILASLGTFALTLFIDKQRGQAQQKMRQRAIELRVRLTRLGPTFVKVGQGLSTRPDLCPPEFLEELAELQDALPTFPTKDAFLCIEAELGRPLESLFSAITPEPIAAASLGQVYKARWNSTGAEVAVKVQRPGIEEAIGLDFYLLRGLCQLVDKYVDILTTSSVNLLDEFATRVYQELNYVQEARNARRFAQLYGDRPDVVVPGVFWDGTSHKVLTMDWIEGIKLSDQDAIGKQGLNILQLVDVGIQCSLRQLLEYGYFHADPHPGNLLATPDGKLAFLDFGMMSETPEQARYAIIGHVVHLVNRDYDAMARDYYALDFLSPEVDVSPIVPALRNFFDDVLTATVSELNFKTIVDGLGGVLYEYPFNVPAYYALILRSLTVLEGLALYTDPDFKVLAASYPYFAKRLLTDPNPYLRDALIELLFKDGTFRWNRLENLLTQGRKDSDYNAKDVLQPVLQLVLGQGGEDLRSLIEREAVRVMEALIVGTAIDSYKAVPEPLRSFIPGGGSAGFIRMKENEQAALLNLRGQVLRVWGLLRSSRGFELRMLQPIVEVLSQPEAQAMSGRVAGGITKRLAARTLQQVLLSPSSAPAVAV